MPAAATFAPRSAAPKARKPGRPPAQGPRAESAPPASRRSAPALPAFARSALGLRGKLPVGSRNDRSEHEAERVADRALRLPASAPTAARKAETPAREGFAPPSVHEALRAPGQPLDRGTRAFVEPRLGHDFSSVRVHTGAAAGQSAHEVGAQAYTVGDHIVFGADRFSPGTPEGRRLLAHELTHVLQHGADAVACLRRAVELRPPGRGEASAFDRRQEITDRMNRLSGGVVYRLDGQRIAYSVTDASHASPFDRQMRAFIDRADVVPLRLITSAGRLAGGGGVLIDFFDAGYVDLDDLRASDDHSFQMNLLHLITERFAVPNYEKRIGTNFPDPEFQGAHAKGLEAETQYLRDTVGDPTIRFVFEEDRKAEGTLEFGFASKEGYRIFHVFLREGAAVSGGKVFVATADHRNLPLDAFIVERNTRAAVPARRIPP